MSILALLIQLLIQQVDVLQYNTLNSSLTYYIDIRAGMSINIHLRTFANKMFEHSKLQC